MTHPLPPDERGEVRVSPSAIRTNGIGKVSSYHLNLTRCIDMPVKLVGNPLGGQREPVARMGRPSGPIEPTKIPYAGAGR